MSEPTKNCIHCGGVILAAALKCKHCKEWVEREPDSGTKIPVTSSTIPDSGIKKPDASRDITDSGTKMLEAGKRVPVSDVGHSVPDVGCTVPAEHGCKLITAMRWLIPGAECRERATGIALLVGFVVGLTVSVYVGVGVFLLGRLLKIAEERLTLQTEYGLKKLAFVACVGIVAVRIWLLI